MRSPILAVAILVGCTLAAGCGGARTPRARSSPYSPELIASVRASEKESWERVDAGLNEMFDRQEKAVIAVLQQALGKGSLPESSSTILLALRKSPLKLRLAPMADGDGNPNGEAYVGLSDSFSERAPLLHRKLAEHTASKAEMKELQDGARYSPKLSDLRTAIGSISLQTFVSNASLQSMSLQTMVQISTLVGERRAQEIELDADDYARIARSLERQRRAEALAAATMGMVAAYQAVINDGGDPKALDVIAESAVKGAQVRPVVAEPEAKKYAEDLRGNIGAQKIRYEQMMRAAYGNANYERRYKPMVDAAFNVAEQAQSQKTQGETQLTELRRCASGQMGPDELYGNWTPSQCSKKLRQLGEEAPEARGGSGNAPSAKALAPGRVGGGVSDTIDAARQLFPADGTIGSSLAGISALSKGDARGALSAAISLVPGGGLVKDGLSLAANLLFGK